MKIQENPGLALQFLIALAFGLVTFGVGAWSATLSSPYFPFILGVMLVVGFLAGGHLPRQTAK